MKPELEHDSDKPDSESANTRWAIWVGSLTVALTMVPYLLGYSFAGNRHFMWLGYNLDDSCVYLSWLRQAFDGSFRAINMFTTEPQHGQLLNPFFLVLGILARLLHLPLLVVLHASRLFFGGCLLTIVWRLILYSTHNSCEQRVSFLFVCFGSGLGWIPGVWPAAIDAWQPEAITYLSLYLSPLFCFALSLQALSALLFMKAIQSGSARYVFWAGIAVCLLGLTHTYDVITMMAIFGAYAVAISALRYIASPTRPLIYAAIIGIIALPAVLYIKHELDTENVFHQRMEVPTRSGPLGLVLVGYGLLMALAVYTVVRLVRITRSPKDESRESPIQSTPELLYRVFLVIWLVTNIAVSYLPVDKFPFQRKMLQGAHIPVSILAGIGAAHLIGRIRGMDTKWKYAAAITSLTLVAGISNILFMVRDVTSFEINLIQTTHMHRPYLEPGELSALRWIETNTPPGTAIQPLPWLGGSGGHFAPVDVTMACFTPGLINRPVYCGHWGETPGYSEKLAELARFALPEPRMTDQARIELLRKMRVAYVLFSQKQKEDQPVDEAADRLAPMFRGLIPVPGYLVKVFSNSDVDIYKVNLP